MIFACEVNLGSFAILWYKVNLIKHPKWCNPSNLYIFSIDKMIFTRYEESLIDTSVPKMPPKKIQLE